MLLSSEVITFENRVERIPRYTGRLPLTTRAGRLLDQRNSLKALQGAGNRGGFHVFRRFRFAVRRRGGGAGEPDQTVAGPFAKLDGPLRRAITVRRGLSSRMV